MIEIHTVCPPNFVIQVHASGAVCAVGDRFLLVKRAEKKPYGLLWGVPGGKQEEGETLLQTAVREVHEETAIALKSPIDVGSLFVKNDYFSFAFHIFYSELENFPRVCLKEDEHIDYKWVTREEAYKLDLMPGGAEVIDYFFAWKNS